MPALATVQTAINDGWPACPEAQRDFARLLYQHADDLCHKGEIDRLRELIQSIPLPMRSDNLSLLYVEATVLVASGRHRTALQSLQPVVTDLLAGDGRLSHPPRGLVARIVCLFVHCKVMDGCYEEALDIAQNARATINLSQKRLRQLEWSCFIALYLLGRHDEAIALAEIVVAARNVHPATKTTALTYLAYMYRDRGDFHRAHELLDEALDLSAHTRQRGPRAMAYLVRSEIYAAQGDCIAALRETERALPLSELAGDAHYRTMASLRLIKLLGLFGRWDEVRSHLEQLQPESMARWNQVRYQAAWAMYLAHIGSADLALYHIRMATERYVEGPASGDLFTLLELLEAAETIQAPTVAELLELGHSQMPAAFIVPRARLAWLQTLHSFRLGGDFTGSLSTFVAVCEQEHLTGILGEAARTHPEIFMDGLEWGIASPLYAAILQVTNPDQSKRLAALALDAGRPEPVRRTAFQLLARQADDPITIQTARALATCAIPDLREASRRLLTRLQLRAMPRADGRLQFRSLGEFALLLDGRPVTQQWRRKAQVLFALLMVQSPHPLRRSRVMSQLWPDLEQRAAANNLRVTMHALRQTLSQVELVELADSHGARAASMDLSLASADLVLWDARELQQYVAVARDCLADGQIEGAASAFSRVIDLYNGPFLPAPHFDEYFSVERRQYSRLAHEAMVELASLSLDRHEPERALAVAERAVEADPLDEVGHLLVMRAHAALGYPHRTKQAFGDYATLLAGETGQRPSPAAERLLERLMA